MPPLAAPRGAAGMFGAATTQGCRALQEEEAAEEAAADEPEAEKESEAHSRTSRKPAPAKLGGERTSDPTTSQHGRDMRDTPHLEFGSPLGVRRRTMTGATRIGELKPLHVEELVQHRLQAGLGSVLDLAPIVGIPHASLCEHVPCRINMPLS